MRRWILWVLIGLVIVLVVPPTCVWYGARPPAQALRRLAQLCDEQAGVKVYGQAETVSGFHDGNGRGCSGLCVSGLYQYKFDYVEASIERGAWPWFSSRPGLYKFFLRPPNDPACDIVSAIHPPFSSLARQSPYHPCVGGEPIARVTSRYTATVRRNYEGVGKATIAEAHQTIIDSTSGETIAESRDYFMSWDIKVFLYAADGRESCFGLRPEFKPLDILRYLPGPMSND